MNHRHWCQIDSAYANVKKVDHDVALIAFIPLLNGSGPNRLPGSYARYSHFERLALRALFASGNKNPTQQLNNVKGLSDYCSQKEFRAALAVTDIKVYLNSLAQVVGASFDYHFEIGYTPIRADVLVPILFPNHGPNISFWRQLFTVYSLGTPKNDTIIDPPDILNKEVDKWQVAIPLRF